MEIKFDEKVRWMANNCVNVSKIILGNINDGQKHKSTKMLKIEENNRL